VLTPVPLPCSTACVWCRQTTAESIRELEQDIEDLCVHRTQLQEIVAHVQRHRTLSTEIPGLEQQQSAVQELERALASKVGCYIVISNIISMINLPPLPCSWPGMDCARSFL
jgi:translation initiation factor 1 (eIF-1/SUI1)